MQKKQHQSMAATGLTALWGVLMLTGCATSASTSPSKSAAAVPTSQEEPKPAIVCANDVVKVRVETADGISLGDYRRAEMTKQIEERLEAKKALNRMTNEERQYEVTVTLTAYKKGSPLERLVSGKMGEIDIDSIVRLRNLTDGKQLSEFTIRENFARGGLGGFSTSYRDAESSFADGVAVALTGQASPRSTNSEWTLR